MRHKDARVRLLAASIMLERGYGKPEQRTDGAMEEAEWLARRGQPKPALLPPPDDDPERRN
jgi:hypothetical protein